MSEQRYRAYHKKYGMIHPDEYFTLEDAINGDLTFFGSPAKDYDTRDFVFMQSTDLKDKNKHEVYNGDILQETFMEKVLEWSLWQVTYEQGAFGVRPLASTGEEPTFRVFHDGTEEVFDLDRYSVIGNMYENHSLVKGGELPNE